MEGKFNKIISKDECKKLIDPSINRSKSLFQASKILFDKEQYPISYSLFVLSIEEEAKALICYLGSTGIIEIRKRHLHIHKNKQYFIGILGMFFFLMNWSELSNIYFQSIINPNFEPVTEKDIPKEINEEMSNFLEFIFTASEYKEIGFYADLDYEGKAISPEKEINKESFPPFYFKRSTPLSNEPFKGVFITNFIQINEISKKIIPPELINKILPIPLDKIINKITITVSNSKPQ